MPAGPHDSVSGVLEAIPSHHQRQRCHRPNGLPTVHDKADFQPAQAIPLLLVLLEHLIRTYTNSGELVLDSCMGSGTTAIACITCIRRGRNFTGFEIAPKVLQDSGRKNLKTIIKGQPQDRLSLCSFSINVCNHSLIFFFGSFNGF